MKVYKLPIGSPQSLGKAIINILPLTAGETIATLLPLPKDPSDWQDKTIVFVTSRGNVRRNSLSDFSNIKANGKIAMKLEEDGEKLVAVVLCESHDDLLLSTAAGKCIRFEADDVRVIVSRASTGVRGIRLSKDDEVISVCVVKHAQFTIEERDAYLRLSKQRRGQIDDDSGITHHDEADTDNYHTTLSPERYNEMETQEQFILSVSTRGFGKRTSAYEYRVAGRGGQGVTSMATTPKNGKIAGSFIIEPQDELMLVTNGGQLIRIATHDIRIAGRATQGVTLFRIPESEQIVSVALIRDAVDDGTLVDGEDDEDDTINLEKLNDNEKCA